MNSTDNYLTPIIDREILFGNPQISGAQLSPNGQYITFIKPLDGTMNIWIKPIEGAFENAFPLTETKQRPITNYFWSRDSRYVLYVQDKGGDENFHIYRIKADEASKEYVPTAKDLTDYENIRAYIINLPKNKPNEIYVGLNDRDAAWHDYYSINIATGERKLLLQNNDKLSSVSFDLNGDLKLASRSLDNGGSEILKFNGQIFSTILEATLEESVQPIKFTKDGNFYFISNIGDTDLSSLYLFDLQNETQELIESDPENEVDIENVDFSEIDDSLVATIYTGDKKRIYWKAESEEKDFNYLKSKFPDTEISITSMTTDETIWIFYVNDDIDPGSAYLLYRNSKLIEYLYTPRPDLPSNHLVRMKPVNYKSIDGLKIPAYLSLPKTTNQDKLPAVLFIHGGPWARDYWGYNSFAQFLANRGYAVLQINFRGSTGYGKKFLNAAINQWGEKMQDDLTAGAQYLIDEGIADPKRIAIAGGSYGGYATLAGLTFTPDVYAAGVSIVGPSNLFTLLDTIPPYWESARTMFHKRMGDPNTEQGRAQLKRQSPFFHAKNIQAPLMVAQGDNDPRVKTAESNQIVIAMRDLDLPVTYLNFPDEGHGFANPKNNMAFLTAMEQFLAEHLGGRSQSEIPTDLKNILAKVTVDISQLTLPEKVSDELKETALAIPTKNLIAGKYIYKLNLSFQGNNINYLVTRELKTENQIITLHEYNDSEEQAISDWAKVDSKNFSPFERKYKQGQMELSYAVTGNKVTGNLEVAGKNNELKLKSELDFLLDGPSLDTYLSLLPLEENYSCIVRILDSMNQKFQTFKFSVTGEESIQAQACYKCELKSIEGAEKSQTLWILKSESPFLIKKHSIIKEMGGAELNLEFVRVEKSIMNNQKNEV